MLGQGMAGSSGGRAGSSHSYIIYVVYGAMLSVHRHLLLYYVLINMTFTHVIHTPCTTVIYIHSQTALKCLDNYYLVYSIITIQAQLHNSILVDLHIKEPHPCLEIKQEHTTEPANCCSTSVKDSTVVINHHHVHSTDRWWAVGHFVSCPATCREGRKELMSTYVDTDHVVPLPVLLPQL